MPTNLEVELEFNAAIQLSEDLKRKVKDTFKGRLAPSFARGRSMYQTLDEPLIVRDREISALQLKDAGDFSDPHNPKLPGEGDYVMHKKIPFIVADVTKDLKLEPRLILPIPAGGELLSATEDEYESNLIEFEHGTPVTTPIAHGKIKNRTWQNQPLGVLVFGVYHPKDYRFRNLLKSDDSVTDLISEYGLSSVHEFTSSLKNGFYQWGQVLTQLKEVIHTNAHEGNLFYDGSTMYLHDFTRCLRRSKLSPEQAYIVQVMRVVASGLAGIEQLLINTEVGIELATSFKDKPSGFNPFLEFLNGYFNGVDEKIKKLSDGLYENTHKTAMARRIGLPVNLAKEAVETHHLATYLLFDMMENNELGMKKPYSAHELSYEIEAYTTKCNEVVQRFRRQNGITTPSEKATLIFPES